MESFKGNFLIFVFTIAIGGAGYWAFNSINSTNTSIIEDSIFLADVGPVIKSEATSYNPKEDREPVVTKTEPAPASVSTPIQNETPASMPVGENSKLVAELQKLIDDKVLMKKGSRGTRVGTVQRFLNEYGIKVSVDNDYGDTTVNAVKKFQQDQKLSADGQAGEGTYKKMIEWLKAN